MRGRWVLWLLPLTMLVGVLGVAISALTFLPGAAYAGFMAESLPEVSRHQIPDDVPISDPAHANRPDAYWLVKAGSGWRAFANRDTGWPYGGLHYVDNAHMFWARSGDWDQLGPFKGGWAPRNLDEFTVTRDPLGRVMVDLSIIHLGGKAPDR